MTMPKFLIMALLAFVPLSATVYPNQVIETNNTCPITFFNLGAHHVPVSTRSALAQKHFDQGINWAYGFNHGEAERNFRKAAELDPTCGMCYWGVAYVLGPNINAAMTTEAAKAAYEATQKALALLDHVTPREQAYIKALATRYEAQPPAERKHLDLAFATAMGSVAEQFPDDLDAASLYAEALMATSPWNYWTEAAKPRAITRPILASLERVLSANPFHPGANHFYIHVTESHYPKLGEAAADRLRGLVPDAGHLVHMPSHIYLRVGRYHEAVTSNQEGIAADKRYKQSCHPQSIYTMMYVPHNYDFAVAAAALEGRSKLAMQTAEEMSQLSATSLAEGHTMVDTQQFWITQMMVMARFGKWQEILAWPEPGSPLSYARGLWHYGRALAFMRLGQLAAAEQEIQSLESIAQLPDLGTAMVMGLNSAENILKIGIAEARGELLAAQGNWQQAIAFLRQGVERQDKLIYMEPPSWYHSVRLSLGEVLLSAKKPHHAERVFRQDLEKFPKNGWALYGLYKALVQKGALKEAASVQERFTEAWQYADIDLKAARF